jgi:hypothetical protein
MEVAESVHVAEYIQIRAIPDTTHAEAHQVAAEIDRFRYLRSRCQGGGTGNE